MRAGKLDRRVTIQQLATGSPQKTPMGAPDKQWADVATVWAAVRPLNGRALFLAQQAESKVNTEIEIRYSSVTATITAAMRAKLGSTIYAIEAVIDPEQKHERLLLQCATGTNQG